MIIAYWTFVKKNCTSAKVFHVIEQNIIILKKYTPLMTPNIEDSPQNNYIRNKMTYGNITYIWFRHACIHHFIVEHTLRLVAYVIPISYLSFEVYHKWNHTSQVNFSLERLYHTKTEMVNSLCRLFHSGLVLLFTQIYYSITRNTTQTDTVLISKRLCIVSVFIIWLSVSDILCGPRHVSHGGQASIGQDSICNHPWSSVNFVFQSRGQVIHKYIWISLVSRD